MLQHDASSAARYGKSALFTASDYGDADARLSERGSDYFGNLTFYFSIQVPHDKLTIEMESYFDIDEINHANLLYDHPLTCGEYRRLLQESGTADLRMAKEYLLDSGLILRSERLASYAADIFTTMQG